MSKWVVCDVCAKKMYRPMLSLRRIHEAHEASGVDRTDGCRQDLADTTSQIVHTIQLVGQKKTVHPIRLVTALEMARVSPRNPWLTP